MQKAKKRHKHLAIDSVASLLDKLHPSIEDRVSFPIINGLIYRSPLKILYCQAEGSLTRITFSNGESILVSRLIRDIENMLPKLLFFRVHNSHIINRNFVDKYLKGNGGSVVMADGKELSVAKSKKQAFLTWMNPEEALLVSYIASHSES